MKILEISRGKLKEIIGLPPSKSYANRALIIACLLKESPLISNLPNATDVTILIRVLGELGLKFLYRDKTLRFLNSFPDCEKESPREIDVGEGGTTARFLATLCLLGKNKYTFVLGERLAQRPWEEFIFLARSLGGKVELDQRRMTLQGPVKFPEKIEINCEKTTQFATAFKLLSVINGPEIVPTKMNASKSYWDMTEYLVREIPVLKEYSVPLDWSSASYPLAYGALNQKIVLPNLFEDSYQADSKFFHILKKFNCVEQDHQGVTVQPIQNHQSISFDVFDCLDLVPTLSFFLANVDGEHRLRGVENLMHKESNRLEEIKNLLRVFNREATSKGDELLIKGRSNRESSSPLLRLPNDHRMVMVASLFLLHHNGGMVSPVEAVSKSYPEFFSLFENFSTTD